MQTVKSIEGFDIRLTDERWQHISTSHPEMTEYYFEILETIVTPEIIYEGNNKEFIAVRQVKETDKYFVVVYKTEHSNSGFIITAFIINRTSYLHKKKIIWQPQS